MCRAHAGPAGQGVEHAREVVPGSGTHVQDSAVHVDPRLLGQGVGERPQVARSQERLARLDHRGRVARAGHEVHVALTGDVERVTVRAAERRPAERELAGAHGASQQVDGVGEHAG